MRFGTWLLIGVVLAGLCRSANAQRDTTATPDSLWTVDLAEIVVSGAQARTSSVTTVQRLGLAEIAQTDAPTIDGVVRQIPAAFVTTNSRGETLIYLRNAGERQTALFFDGASLNVPWDQRFDIGFVPVGVVGGMTVAKGVPSVLYGTNVIGGAINLTSRTLTNEGAVWEASGRLGSAGTAQVAATHLGRRDRWSHAFAGGYATRDGLVLPDDADLPFSQPGDDLRANTDQQLLNGFGQVAHQFEGGARLALTGLYLDGEKGVAPESHLDPATESVRYWRYPTWRNAMLILSGDTPLGKGGTRLRGAAWGMHFRQQIEQFESVAFDAVNAIQDDEDDTIGGRLTLLQPMGPGELRLAVNALTAQHEQQDYAPEETDIPVESYRQHIFSAGVEYEWQPASPLNVLLGVSLDGIATPETGDKPARDPQTDFGAAAGGRYELTDGWALRISGGRKVRFPTMRELFGEALRRFLVNPDLGPETSWLAEAGVVRLGAVFSGEATVFLNRTLDTIDRINVEVGGQTLRQRVNLDGSRVAGIEFVGGARPARGLRLDGHLTYVHAQAYDGDGSRPLAEKPEWLGTLTAIYQTPIGFSALVEGVYTGGAFSLDEDNSFHALPTSLVLNARLGFRLILSRPRVVAAELFARVNNLTDEVVMPQLGLPGPGREVSGGLSLSL